MHTTPMRRSLAATLSTLMLAGCASVDHDAAFGPVAQAAQEHVGQPIRWTRDADQRAASDARVAELLAQPIGPDAAVQIALLNNRGLQAAFEQLGITEAERVQALRLPNPGFSFGRLRRGDEVEIERGLHLDLARLLAAPIVGRLEARRVERAQQAALLQVLSLAADARKAQVQAVAAEETVRYRRQVQEAADAGAELARRMAEVGNFSKLQRLREQGFLADAALNVARAERERISARERLTRLMGLWGPQTRFTLPDRLPDLPATPDDLPDVERDAITRRLDVRAARLAAEQTAANLGLTKATRFINVLELGVQHNSSNEAPRQTGWEIGVELPLFDTGDARLARAEGVYLQAVHRTAETAVNARSEVREAYAGYRHAWDIARHHRDELVPLRRQIADENLLRYNGMLIGVFELLADARAQVAGVNAYIEALRDFWLARADLDMARLGPTRLTPPAGSAPAAAADGAGH
ncbi:TolC family protein [uncultured Methylibium sp.]|uniref:TolC family protein n=1 Tax=uncultured Methylibium sp. TaxID=381093 RepID=UPI0025FD569B|nr:TolC family protein [uncultured Methylibium sp.]